MICVVCGKPLVQCGYGTVTTATGQTAAMTAFRCQSGHLKCAGSVRPKGGS